MKNKIYLETIGAAAVMIVLFSNKAVSQNNQDCISAVKVCTNSYIQNTANSGFGSVQDVVAGATCLGDGETNSTWYTFKIKTAGTISFQINPVNAQDDYDFSLYNLTNNTCTDLLNGVMTPVRCNFSSTTGNTGLSAGYSTITSTAGGSNQNSLINVQVDDVYYLLINNFTATSAGYELNFGGTATIYDTDAPSLTNAVVSPCSPRKADVYFSEDINCASIATDGSDFVVTGPSPVTVSGAVGQGCGSGSLAGNIRLTFASPVTMPGTYKIKMRKGTDGNTVSDFCDNKIAVGNEISFTVTFAGPAASIVSSTNTDCSNSGTATAAVTGGVAPYTYTWNTNPAQHTLHAQNLPAGLYNFMAVDANNCSTTTSIRIQQTGNLSLSTTFVGVECHLPLTGSATVIASGGSAPYSYSWNTVPAQTTATAIGLAAGNYSVVVTTATGCTFTSSVTIPLLGLPVLTYSQTNVSCNGLLQGSASVTTTGNAPFTYQWSNALTANQITGLNAGSYTVTVTDNVGCTKETTVQIGTGGMQLTTTKVDLTCATHPTGTATIAAQNGTAPYAYSWLTNPVQSGATAQNLFAGTYTVIVTDAGGCKDSTSVQILSPAAIATNVITTQSACGLATGSATTNIAGGVAPYTFLWSTTPAQVTSSALNLAAGIFSVTVTDNTGCSAIATAYISNPDGPQGFISDVVDATCNRPNGSASVTNVTGNPPFNYAWNTMPRQNAATANSLREGIYYVMIEDSLSCVSFLHVKINAVEQATISVASIEPASCGKNDGSAITTGTGGVLPYTFAWVTNPIQANASATNLGAGNYTCVLTDGNGCKSVATVTIPENKANNDFTFTPACLHSAVTLTAVTDYNQQVNWHWHFGDDSEVQSTSAYTNEIPHIFPSTEYYYVILVINGGCASDTITKLVKGAYKPDASFTTRQNHFYVGAAIEFIYTGSDVSLYEWQFDTSFISYNETASYAYKSVTDNAPVSLYVTDQYGCRDTAEAILNIDYAPAVFLPSGFTPNGDGLNDAFTIPSHGLKSCKMQVVNRWGQTVFVSDNPSQLINEGWNGTLQGQPAPNGTYTYLLSGSLESGKPETYTGTITLLR